MRGSQKNKNYIIKWTPEFAYAVGLFTADGCLSSDGRHLMFTSKDIEQIKNFMKCLRLKNKIGRKISGYTKIKKYYQVQFSNKKLYEFLCKIGLKPRKSLSLKKLNIPSKFFPDFLRGLFDGDGSFKVFKHPESQYDQIRFRIISASPTFLKWLYKEIKREINTIGGFITKTTRAEELQYGIEDSLKILNCIYYSKNIIYLSRKFQKIKPYI